MPEGSFPEFRVELTQRKEENESPDGHPACDPLVWQCVSSSPCLGLALQPLQSVWQDRERRVQWNLRDPPRDHPAVKWGPAAPSVLLRVQVKV